MDNLKELEDALWRFVHDSEILKVEWDKTAVSSSITITVLRSVYLKKVERYQVICTDILDFYFNLDNGFSYITDLIFSWNEKDSSFYLSIDPYDTQQGISEKDNCVVICRQLEIIKVA